MGLFHRIKELTRLADRTVNHVADMKESTMDKATSGLSESAPTGEAPDNMQIEEDIVLASSFHTVEEEEYGDDDSRYLILFR